MRYTPARFRVMAFLSVSIAASRSVTGDLVVGVNPCGGVVPPGRCRHHRPRSRRRAAPWGQNPVLFHRGVAPPCSAAQTGRSRARRRAAWGCLAAAVAVTLTARTTKNRNGREEHRRRYLGAERPSSVGDSMNMKRRRQHGRIHGNVLPAAYRISGTVTARNDQSVKS